MNMVDVSSARNLELQFQWQGADWPWRLEHDGWMDAVMTVLGGHPIVLMNRGGNHHCLTISCADRAANRRRTGSARPR